VTQVQTWIDVSAYDVRGDIDLDGDVDATDKSTIQSSYSGITLGRGKLSASSVASRKGFAGYEHTTIGQDSARARMLVNSLGRWASRDLSGYVDGQNLYGYARSAPVRHVDPSGLQCMWNGATSSASIMPEFPVQGQDQLDPQLQCAVVQPTFWRLRPNTNSRCGKWTDPTGLCSLGPNECRWACGVFDPEVQFADDPNALFPDWDKIDCTMGGIHDTWHYYWTGKNCMGQMTGWPPCYGPAPTNDIQWRTTYDALNVQVFLQVGGVTQFWPSSVGPTGAGAKKVGKLTTNFRIFGCGQDSTIRMYAENGPTTGTVPTIDVGLTFTPDG
jgi:RHS repeat-associated protein